MGNRNLTFFQKTHFFGEYLFLRFVALIVNSLPYRFSIPLARNFGAFLFFAMRSRRRIALDNLKASFPGKSEEEVQLIGCSAFKNMAQMAVEFVAIPKLVRKGFIKTSNEHNVWDALKKGRGLIFIVSHLTNWESQAVAVSSAGMPIHAIGRPLKNPFVYDYVKRLRGFTGLKSIDKAGAIRETAKLLRQNQIVAFLIDQHERQGAVQVQFFGRPCFSTGVPARIALKWNVPVLATFCYRDKQGILTTDFEKPFDLIQTGNEEADVQANTQLFVSAIEKKVKERPGEWLWMHRRWRPEYGAKEKAEDRAQSTEHRK